MAKFNVPRLQEFFLEMAADTASGAIHAALVLGRPWEREFCRKRGELTYIDRYVANGEWSGGNILILVSDVTAWLMGYGGWCKNDDKEVLIFLQAVLHRSYTAREFRGGRGPSYFEEDGDKGLVYENWPNVPPFRPQNFTNFLNCERIWRKPARAEDLFWHRCQGLLLGEPE